MAECEWNHEPVGGESERFVRTFIGKFNALERKWIEDVWGRVPELLCAHDFNILLSQVNDHFDISKPAAL